MSLTSILRDLWDSAFRTSEASIIPPMGQPFIPTPAIRHDQDYLLSSTAIRRVRYVPDERKPGFGDVWITFMRSPKEYLYPSVPEQAYKEFIGRGGSRGRNFHELIKPYAKWEEVHE